MQLQPSTDAGKADQTRWLRLLHKYWVQGIESWLPADVSAVCLLQGEFLHNMLQEPRTIVNALAINEDNVMVTGGDNGALWCESQCIPWEYCSALLVVVLLSSALGSWGTSKRCLVWREQ